VGWINLAQDRRVAGHCERRNLPSGYIKRGGFFDIAEEMSSSDFESWEPHHHLVD
jgi:hypothetical protein